IVIDGNFSGVQRGIWGLGTVLVNDGTIEWMEDELHLFDDGALVNNGTIQKTLVAVFAPFMTQGGVDTGSRLFTNNGTIDVQVGRLDLDAESRHVGAVLMASASATLDFGGGSSVTHTFAGTTTGAPEGVVQFSGDPSIVPEAGAVWNVGGTGLQWRDAYLYGNETLTNQGLVVFDGTITGNQRGVSGAGTVLANEGTIDWIEDEFYMDADGVLTNSGLLRVLPSIFVSRLLVSGGGTGVFTNTGTVSVEGTTFEVDAPFDHQAGGIIAGDGVIDLAGSTFTHSGDTAPGVSPGILDWRGQPWNAPSGSSLFIEIGGTVVGDDYDQLDVNGAAALDGTLEIIVTSTAGLTVGDTFTILTASRGVTGTFASIAVDGVPGPSFSVAYNANDVALTLDALESPLTLRGQPGWRTLATPFPDLPLGGREFGMLEPVYTAGYVGAQRDQRNNRGTANVFLYDESTGVFAPPFNDDPIGGGVGFWIYVFNDDDSFTPGTQGGFPKPLNASGTPATFPFTIPVTYTPSVVRDPLTTPALGFNLVGNPANEDLDWDDPNWTKTNVSDVLYIYDPKFNDGDGGFRTWNGTTGTLPSGGTIPVGQGFHVETTSADPELVAPTSALLGTQSSFYRLTSGEADLPASAGKTAESSPLLRLHLDALVGGVQRTSEAFVSFEKDAALGFDSRDARLLAAVPGGTHARLYTALGEVHGEEAGTALQISALPAPEEGVLQIDLGAEVLQDGEAADASATISWDALALPEAWSATLTDRQTGEKYDLTAPGSAGLVLAAEEALTVTEADAGTSRATDQSLIDAAVALGEVLPTPKSPQARALKTIAPVASLTSSASPATRFVIEIDPLGALAGETEASLSTVYPNPASRVARLELRLLEETDVQVSVYDVLGRRVAEVQDGVLAAGVHTVEVPVAALAPGTYVVRVDGSGLGKSRQLTVTQ
ncbi:MAG: T9SS type A sorting domain-containing protein, partial [Bacteroidota bacterium]